MDVRQVSTNGFIHNLQHVCLGLCDPFLDPKFSKHTLISDTYLFSSSSRIDITEDTRVVADKSTADEYAQEQAKAINQTSPNFITEMFFLTTAYHHYGVLSSIRYDGNLGKQLQKMKEQAERLKADHDRGAWEGPMKPVYVNQFKNFQVLTMQCLTSSTI
jgi:ubiquitin conjugation factor E4 B